MIYFFSIAFLTIVLYSLRIFGFKKKRRFLGTLTLLLSSTLLIYLYKGSLKSFTFQNELKEDISDSIEKGGVESLTPSNLILFLENESRNAPLDSQGWLILARTCMMAGYLQKADLYYREGLKHFPEDVNLLFEYSNLKSKSGRLEEAIEIIEKILEISPTNEVFMDKKKKLLFELQVLEK